MSRQEILSALTGFVSAGLAGIWGSKIALAALLLTSLDLITGFVKAWVTGKVESHKFGKGVYKICAYVSVIAGLRLLGDIVPHLSLIADGLIGAFLFREFMSNIENMFTTGEAMGVHLPGIITLVRLLRLNEEKLLNDAGKTLTEINHPDQADQAFDAAARSDQTNDQPNFEPALAILSQPTQGIVDNQGAAQKSE